MTAYQIETEVNKDKQDDFAIKYIYAMFDGRFPTTQNHGL